MQKPQLNNPQPRLNTKGFGLVGVLLILLALTVVAGAGVYVYHRNHKKTVGTATTTSGSTATNKPAPKPTPTPVDPYAGWRTYCDSAIVSCIKYPTEWAPVNGFPGAFENSANTAYVSLSAGTTKDQSRETAYISSLDNLTTSATPLDIVGLIVNNKPGYMVYDASYVTANNIKVGSTVQVAYGNYAFESKVGTVSLVGTPGAAGFAVITSLEQAKAWFATSEAQADLLVMKSLYYQ